MKLHRFFSAPIEGQYDPAHVYNGLVFKEYVSVIRNADQSVLSKYHLVAPDTWSMNAIDIMASKYCRKAGVPDLLTKVWEENIPEPLLRSVPKTDAVFGGEHDARQVIDRVVGCWAYHGWKMGYFDSPDEALIFFDELRWLIVRQYLAPASPQWFNAGLHWAYGIEGSKSGLWSITNDGAVVECENSYEKPLLHACFIQGITDDLIGPGGIMDLVTREARVFKFGGGSGTNFSSLRGKKEPLSGGGQSSGMMSFIKINDRAAGAIKSGGTTRRAARMVVVDVDHPEIEEFINWKVVEEDKVAALVAGSKLLKKFAHRIQEAYTNSLADLTEVNKIVKEGVRAGVPKRYLDRLVGLLQQGHSIDVKELTTDYEGEAYQTVSGQNANNTIRVTNEFMNNALNHQTYQLRYRTNLEYGPTVNAAEIFDKINLATWISADPGIHFADTINGWNTCLNDGEIVASNPCCFRGDTLVDTSEGRIRIDRLVEMSANGQTLPYAFAYDSKTGSPVLRQIKRAWKAGRTTQLAHVITNKGVDLYCTPEHRFLTYDGRWVMACDLSKGTRLRKIARHANKKRAGRISISDKNAGTKNGTKYQNVWMWEQVYGPVPDNHEIHHRNGNPTDDRLSNFECKDRTEHRSEHSSGEGNPRWLDVSEQQLLEVWESLAFKRSTRWNQYIRDNGLVGVIPMAQSPTLGGRIRGMTWDEFSAWMQELSVGSNDAVVSVEIIEQQADVFDIEVDGVHNFGVTNSLNGEDHSLIVHNSEYFWLNDTGCNLASLKLTAFVVGSGFHCEAFINAASLITIALDITVSIAGYPSKEIAQGSYMYRTLGLGYCDLGALLMRFGLPYDSDDARTFAGCLTAMMHFSSMRTSALLADELALSSFPRYADNKEHVLRVMRNHVRACLGDDNFQGLAIHPKTLPLTRDLNGFLRHYKEKADEIAVEALSLVENYGLRNAQLTLLAPTGTIGLLLDCDTTGVEPDYALVKFKKLAGGGVMKIVNQSVAPALAKLGYASQEIENIKDYVLGVGNKCPEQFLRLLQQHQEINGVIDLNQVFDLRHVLPSTFPNIEHWNAVICGTGTLEGAPHLKPEHLPIFDCANRCGRTGTRYIGMTGHILMMAYVQPFLSGAISKTINLDEKATVETIREGNILSWQSGLKANAMYRDGSKLSQPLMAVDDDFADTTEEPVKAIDGLHKIVEAIEQRGIRRKLANKRRGYTRKLVAGGHKFYLRTGEYGDGTIGEIFLDSHKEGTSYRGIMNSFAMAVSLGLQYGVPLEEFVEAFSFQRYEPSGIVTGHDRLKVCTSILDLVFRDLAIEYLGRDDLAHTPPEGTLEEIVATDVKKEYASRATVLTDAKALGFEGSACSVCKSMTLVRRGKCLSCQTCGNSTGCD